MDHRSTLVGLALAALTFVAQAAYTSGQPPAGFTGSPGAWAYKPGSAEKWLARTAETRTTVNVGGRAVTMNALLRMSATAAPRVAAAAVWTPVGRAAALGVAMAALGAQLLQDGIEWSQDRQRWERQGSALPPQYNLYCVEGIYGGCQTPDFSSIDAAIAARKPQWDGPTGLVRCDAALGTYPKVYSVNCQIAELYTSENPPIPSQFNGIHIGNVRGFGGQVEAPPVQPVALSESEFQEVAAPYITPDAVPDLAPNQPIPVELPVMNPSDDPEPVAKPLRVPMGDPLPDGVPVGDAPQKWRQPVVDLIPSPTQQDPWRVDAQPKDVITEAPQGQPAPDPITEPVTPDTGSPNQTTPTPPGLCDQYPDILACKRVEAGSLEATPVQNQDKAMAINPDSGWGPSSGSCPAPRNITVHGSVGLEISYTPLCTFAEGIRPIVIAMAWLASCLTFFGFVRGN